MALTLSGDDGVAGVNGSATTPAIQGTDTNTGLTFGTDTVNVVTGGSTRATVDSSGRLLVGTSSASGNQTDGELVLQGSSQGEIYLSRGSTPGNSGSGLGFVNFTGSNGADSAGIKVYSDGGTWTDGSSHPSRIAFNTCADGSSSPTEQMRLTSGGDLRFNSGYGSVATAYGVRAWVNFDGTGTVAIRADGNVSSITDNGTGDYTVNFTTAMPDNDYCVCGTVVGSGFSGGLPYHCFVSASGNEIATSSFRINIINANGNQYDMDMISVAAIR